MTWEEMPPPSKYQNIAASSITNYQEMLDYFDNMTEEQSRDYLQKVLDTMTYEEQAEFLRRLSDPS